MQHTIRSDAFVRIIACDNAETFMQNAWYAACASCEVAEKPLGRRILQRGDNLHVILGTTSVHHVEENYRSTSIELSDDVIEGLDTLITPETLSGPRYSAATQKEINTEQFAHE